MSKKSIQPTYKGLPLIDATKDLEICVTKSDVSRSRKNDPSNCAAANSLKRVLETEVEVHISRTYVKEGKKWVRYITPQSVQREITSFDRGSSFEPGEYNLKAPSKACRLGSSRSTGERTGEGTSNKPKYHITANIRESAKLGK